MESTTLPAASAAPDEPAPALAPVAVRQRIEALDVVRGFALLGIFLMNIEYFNRPLSTMSEGMPRGLTGADWWATWFVNYFVQGKFWTIFSLLFGMGFAVMMVRAERAGREFKRVYLRRVLALAVFGAAHYVFLWEGDILFTYAVAALMLMVVLHGRPRPLLLAIGACVGLGFAAEAFFAVASGLAIAGLIALYLRSERLLKIRGHAVPLFSFLLLGLGGLLGVGAAAVWLWPDAPIEPRMLLPVFAPLVLVAGWLSWKYREPAGLRGLRLGAGLYTFAAIAMTLGGLAQYLAPDPDADLDAAAAAPASAAVAAASGVAPTPPAVVQAAASQAPAAGEKDRPKTKAERAAERRAERQKRLAKARAEKAEDRRVHSQGRYGDTVALHARNFPEKVAGDFGGSMLFMGMFLLGMWFVRSGVMDDTAAHLPLFRRLAIWGLPIGIGLGLAGSLIAMSHTTGDRGDGWGIAQGLLFLGNLPACLGYVGLVVTLLHSKTALAHVRVLAPLGRMTLTNYLLQSLLCALVFYGYGMGQWGMPRAQQILFVLVVFAAQLAFSHWWLARFRYGPAEWFWRGYTYRQTPKFRL
jgi:uncharacterized protein